MILSAAQIKKIHDYFAKQKDVVAVYLYGSYAYGNPHKRSDIDFGVVFDPPIKTYYRLGEIINDLIDLKLPDEPDVRNINLQNSSVYLMNVVSGKLIYSKDEVRRIAFEVAIFNQFYDTQRMRNVNYYYMDKRLQEGTYGY